MRDSKNYAALLATLWALLFGILHLLWAVGVYIGLPKEQAKEAFERNWFYIYNLIVALLCFLACALGITLYRNKTRWRKLIIVCSWFSSVLLILRGAVAVLSWLYFILSNDSNGSSISFWDIWILIGGVLFLVSVRRFERLSFA